MDIIKELNEYKAKVESLAMQAAKVEGLETTIAEHVATIATANSDLETLKASLQEIAGEKEALEKVRGELETEIAALKGEKKEIEDKATEMLANLGFSKPVEVDRKEINSLIAEDIQKTYLALQKENPRDAAKFYAENRDAILKGYID